MASCIFVVCLCSVSHEMAGKIEMYNTRNQMYNTHTEKEETVGTARLGSESSRACTKHTQAHTSTQVRIVQ